MTTIPNLVTNLYKIKANKNTKDLISINQRWTITNPAF